MSARDRGSDIVRGIDPFITEPSGVTPDFSEEVIALVEQDGPIGHVPPPLEAEDLDDERMASFLDKLGERLAFERTGTRLYEAVIAKLDAYGSWSGGPDRDDLERIRGQELMHFRTLVEIIQMCGGDPTAITPSADVVAQIGSGICAVVNDPRTNLVQSLEAMLVAELSDTECWVSLIELAEAVGRDDIAETLEPFITEEEQHVDQVRRWLALAQHREVPPTEH
jgi:rubrerythrin